MEKVIYDVLDKLEKNSYEAYIVGGYVRETLLGKTAYDIDITTSARPKEVVETVAEAAHFVEVEQHVRHPVLVHCDEIAALRILGGEPVPVGVHPIMVEPRTGTCFAVLAGLAVYEVIYAGIGIYPHREAAHSVRVLRGNEKDDSVLKHLGHCLVIDSGIVEHHGDESLRAGDFIAVDSGAEIHYKRYLVEIDLVGLGWIEYLEVVLADLVEPALVAGGGDADLKELASFEGISELLYRDPVGFLSQILHIAGDVAPVGKALVEFEAEELLGGHDVLVIFCILYRKVVLHR